MHKEQANADDVCSRPLDNVKTLLTRFERMIVGSTTGDCTERVVKEGETFSAEDEATATSKVESKNALENDDDDEKFEDTMPAAALGAVGCPLARVFPGPQQARSAPTSPTSPNPASATSEHHGGMFDLELASDASWSSEEEGFVYL